MDERLMTLRLQLANACLCTNIFYCSDDVKDCSYDNLCSTLRMISSNDRIILQGDFYARVGMNHDIWQVFIGYDGVCNMNSSGFSLSAFKWALPSKTPSSSVTCTRLHGCINGPNTDTSSTTSLSGAVTCTKCKLL